MIRLAIPHPMLFYYLRNVPVVRWFIGFDMTRFNDTIAPEIQKEIFASFYVPDGTSRQTGRHRFDDLDELTTRFVLEQKNPVIHDVAVADGSSSLALLQMLKKKNVAAMFYISDKYSAIMIEKDTIGRIYGSNGRMISAYFCGLIAEKGPKVFLGGRWLFSLLTRNAAIDSTPLHACRLLSPELSAYIEKKELVEIEYDLFAPRVSMQCTFVRCMNVLNRNYFTDQKLAEALQNITDMLCDGGILLIGRTVPGGRNEATFYKKQDNAMVAVEKINRGYEADSLVTKLAL